MSVNGFDFDGTVHRYNYNSLDNIPPNIAPAYSASSTYAVGDYCTKDNVLYKCSTAISTAEAWNSAHWTQVQLATDVADADDIITNLNTFSVLLSQNVRLTAPNFVHGAYFGNGTFSDVKYRIATAYKIEFVEPVTYTIQEGFRVRIARYDKATGEFINSPSWYTGTVTLDSTYLFNITIARETENESEIADINEFIKKVYVSTDVKPFIADVTYLYPYGLQPYQMSMFKHSDNLFSNAFCNYLNAAYYGINSQNKLTIKTTSNWKGWLVRIKPNTTYTLGPVDFTIYFFTPELISEKNIQTSSLSDSQPNTIVSGPNSYWASVTQRIDRDMSEWMMVEGDTYPSAYISGFPQWIDTPKACDDAMTYTTFAYNYNPITIVHNSNNSVVTIPAATRIITPKGAIATTDEETVLTFTNSGYFGFDATTGIWKAGNHLVGREFYLIGYVNVSKQISYVQAFHTEKISKTIAFMGDSITAGVATQKCYHEYIHDRYGFTCLNYGYGGSGYYRSYPGNSSGRLGLGNEGMGVPITQENAFTPNNVIARLSELNPSALDGIVIFAGTNDWGNSVSVEDYISGIESAFEYCKTNYTTIPVLVMTPIHRGGDTVPNSQGKTLSEYVDILISECRKYSMAYVDCMTMTGLYPDIAEERAAFFSSNIASGLHPSEEGHKRIACAIGEKLKEVIDCHTFSMY